MTSSPLGSRIATRLDEAAITLLLQDVAEQVSQSYYLFLPHPGSLTSYAAAPQAAPTFVEVVVDFPLQQVPGYTVVSPALSWRADGGSGSHQAAEMIAAEFRYAIRQVDPGSYELGDDDQLPGSTGPGFGTTGGAGESAFAPATHRYGAAPVSFPPTPAAPAAPPVSFPPAPMVAPAAPTASPAPASVPPAAPTPAAAPITQPPAAPVPTPAAPASPALSLQLITAQGQRIPLPRFTVIGRQPGALAEHPDALVLPLPDGARRLSKTHALIEFDGVGLWVTDLGSTNGTSIIGAAGPETCARDVRTAIAPGSRLSLGGIEVTFASR